MTESPIDRGVTGLQHSVMPEVVMITFASIFVVLLVLILTALIRIGSKLGGFERTATPLDSISTEKESSSEVSYDGAFGKFMDERPELLGLKKSEQFAAFRKWRKEQGLNWDGK